MALKLTRLGALLRIKREAAELTEMDISRRMHVFIRQVRAWESGEQSPTKRELRRLAMFFGCPADELLGNEPITPYEAEKVRRMLSEERV